MGKNNKPAETLPVEDTSFDPTTFEANGQAEAAPNPFDPESLRLDQNTVQSLGVKKLTTTVPVRKPTKAEWVRTHPDSTYCLQTAVIELKDERSETYLVHPRLWPSLSTEATFAPRALFTAMSRQGVVFLWPVRLPGSDGRIDAWSQSAMDAVERARRGWVRVTANMALGAYEIFMATAPLPEPEWPELSFADLLKIGFKDRFIQTSDHPVLRKLRGEV